MQKVVCLLGIDPSDGKAIPVYVIKQREEARRATGRIGNRHNKLFKVDIVEPTKVTNDDTCQ